MSLIAQGASLSNAARHEVVDHLRVDGITYLDEVEDLEQRGKETLHQQYELGLDVAEEHHLRRLDLVLDCRPI